MCRYFLCFGRPIDRNERTNFQMGIQKWTVELDVRCAFCYENRDLPLIKRAILILLIQYPERARNYRSLLKNLGEPGKLYCVQDSAPANATYFPAAISLTHRTYYYRKRSCR
jgi:hypothetical protein